jgi:hypothetical protein
MEKRGDDFSPKLLILFFKTPSRILRVFSYLSKTQRKATCDSRNLMEKTSPKFLLNRLSLRFPELLLSYQIHREVFDRPFNFSAFYKTLPPDFLKPDQQFLEWFVGFSEGDGCFCVSATGRCSFTISQRDELLLQLIRQTLGFGSICPVRNSPGMFHYNVSSLKKDIFPLIQLFNGNLLLKKTNKRFKSWVANYNRRCGTELKVVSRWDGTFKTVEHDSQRDPAFQEAALQKTSVVWNSSWLSGFIEAEGCFSVLLRKPDVEALKFQWVPQYQIVQKGESELVLHVAFLIGRGCFSRSVWERLPVTTLEDGIYRFMAGSRISVELIQGYLIKHPLRGKKALSYSKWCQLLLELSKFKELLRRSRALHRACRSITPIDLKASSFPHEKHEKLLALAKDINPSESKKV